MEIPLPLTAPTRAGSHSEDQELLEGPHSRRKELWLVLDAVRDFIGGVRTLHFAGPCVTVSGSARYREGIMSTVHTTALAVLLLSAGAGAVAQDPALPPPPAAPILQDLIATQTFQQRVDEYVTLHRLLEAPLPPLRPTRDMSQIHSAMRALAFRIQLARGTAQQGDIITPDVARLFRARIAACLTPEAWAAILAARDTDEEGQAAAPVPALRVNMEWPAQVPYDFVPPQLLLALPPLPPELQYRIIGRALVLWDHHANLIVDILPGAFASTT